MNKRLMSALLSKGYFPKELPPVFTTKDFGVHADAIVADWHSAKVFTKIEKKKKGHRSKYSYNNLLPADPEVISKPKKLYERRNIHVTHPIPQALLAKEIADNWKTIQKWLSNRRFSQDEIVISDKYDRAIKGINFPIHRAKNSYIESSSDWIIKTDISRFYPTIYTHSIPWAAYGKEKVKSALKTYDGTVADRLDSLVRHCNRNQTVGIPIGPETSRILAEIISSRIDLDFSSCRHNFRDEMIDRLQDDWVIGTESLDKAEQILSIVANCYREYGLDINGSKTSINHIFAAQKENWKSDISAFLSHRSGALHCSRLEEFLALCLQLQLEFPNAPVLSYCLSIIEGKRLQPQDIIILESFLLKAANISPVSMDRICRIILNIDHYYGGLSKRRISDRFSILINKYFENGSLFEVIWILYTFRGLKRPIRTLNIMRFAENVPSSVIRLLLLDMNEKGLCATPPPIAKWEEELNSNRVLSDWSWLFAYEGIRNGWLKDVGGLMAKPFFKAMNDRNVVFYEPQRNVRKSESVKQDRLSERREHKLEAERFIEALRGANLHINTDFSDY